MLRKLLIILMAFSFSMGNQLSAQKLLSKAEKLYETKSYNQAIQNYLSYIKGEGHADNDAKLMLAECYRLTNEPVDAVIWYRKAKGIEGKKEHLLNYAHTLKKIGKYEKASELYSLYGKYDPIIAEHFVLSCEFAKHNLISEDLYELRLFGGNSKHSDFGVSFYNGKVVFSSFRANLDGVSGDRADKTVATNNQLIYTLEDNPKMRDPLYSLRSGLDKSENLGPISYARDLSRCAYTKNNFKDGFNFISNRDNNLSIYLADSDQSGDFNNEQAFIHNEAGYASGFPCMAFSGTALYFASNRPGGYGGYDLYVSYNKNGNWTRPENLGASVNSPGNEITPYFDGEDLFYSSDYHHGLGGFDVFKSTVLNGEWTFAENMGKGVNSLSDDYFFSVNPTNGDYYVTSNRLGGRGSDDIYIAKPLLRADFTSIDPEVPTAVKLSDIAMRRSDKNPVKKNVNFKKTVNAIPPNSPQEALVPSAVDVSNYKPKFMDSDLSRTVPERVTLPIYDINEAGGSNKNASAVNTNETTSITNIVAKNKASSAFTKGTKEKISFENARLVALNDVIANGTNVYFVQVAALFETRVNLQRFENLRQYGNLYKVFKSQATKVRLGYYSDKSEAIRVLKQVRSLGYRDAFIAFEPLDIHEVQLAVVSEENSDPYASNYKIRLASYENPIWFDVKTVDDLGKIEQWTKGDWTIFVLSGFRSLEEAENARIKAVNRGYTESELVIDNDGILEPLVRN